MWNEALEISSKELRCMVSTKMLLNYTYCTIPFTVHIIASDKQLCAVISQNNKNIAFFVEYLASHSVTTL